MRRSTKWGVLMVLVTAAGGCGKKEGDSKKPPDIVVDDFPPDPPTDQAPAPMMLTQREIVQSDEARGVGPWTFGALFRGLMLGSPTDREVSAFAKKFLADWERSRPGIWQAIYCPWVNASTYQSDCSADGELRMEAAPFQLMAIANRLDLHQEEHCEDAGELRFAFALVGARGVEQPLAVIFEYAVPTHEMPVMSWAVSWNSQGFFACTETDCQRFRDNLKFLTNAVTKLKTPPPPPADEAEGDSAESGAALTKSMSSAEPFLPEPIDPTKLTSNLRHLRIRDKALGETELREYVWETDGKGGVTLKNTMIAGTSAAASEAIDQVKCAACHAGEGEESDGARFNLKPGAKGEQRVHEFVKTTLPDRETRAWDLQNSTCETVGGDPRRSVPW